MPVERLRMRPWLERILNDGIYPGVQWLDKHEKIFRLPWKHASRSCWQLNSDACLFRAWAEHTGKCKNKDKPSAKMWKANFRCALNSLPDMVELHDRRSTKGDDAFKVYKIIDRTVKKRNIVRKGRKRKYGQRTRLSNSLNQESEEQVTNLQSLTEQMEEDESEKISSLSFLLSNHEAFWDHDYVNTNKFFDVFHHESEEDIIQNMKHYEHPESKIIKTEPKSQAKCEFEDEISLYKGEIKIEKDENFDEEINNNKVLSDDDVIDLLEMTSDCSSLDTVLDDLCEDDVKNFEKDFKTRTQSLSTFLDDKLDTLFQVEIPSQNRQQMAKSKSMSDITSLMKTTPNEFLRSCL